MPKRYPYDLSHYSFMTGKLGRLMTLTNIPIVAGDSIGLNIAGAIRMSPLRRDLALDALVDLFAFFVPHRHVYGDNWIDFIRQGADETVTFPTVTATEVHQYLGVAGTTGLMPLWMISGYNRIWNRYFRVPNGAVGELSETGINALQTTTEGRVYGQLCARLKTLPTTGHGLADAAADDNRFIATVSGNNATISLTGLERQKAHFKTELERHWFGRRYTDVLERVYGGYAGSDADERPTLLMRESQWMSGYDVDGSGDANLGQYAGKAATVLDMNIPKKFFPEHGVLWIMALVRFPTIFELEKPYLTGKHQPTYDQIAGDPDTVGNRAPHTLLRNELFNGVGALDASNIGFHPYGQWYRYQPSVVHSRFDELSGFPFIPYVPLTVAQAQYHQTGDYDHVFATTQLGHWRSQFRVNVMANRVVPGPLSSIYTGV